MSARILAAVALAALFVWDFAVALFRTVILGQSAHDQEELL